MYYILVLWNVTIVLCDNITTIKQKHKIRVVNVAHTSVYSALVGIAEGRRPRRRCDSILKLDLKNKDRSSWTGFFRYKISTIRCHCKFYNKTSNLRDFGKIPDELSNHQFLKKGCSMELITNKQTHSPVLIFPVFKFTFGFHKYVISHSPNNASTILRAA